MEEKNTLYVAHINEKTGKIQTVKQHSINTANICSSDSIEDLKDLMYIVGLLHDVGKYQCAFQKRILGENIRVEHSTCGAIVAREKYPMPACLIMEYCIAGHHSGIPDGGTPDCDETTSTLYGRMKRKFEEYSVYKEELRLPEFDNNKLAEFLTKNCGENIDNLIDVFSFFVRYCFSCLVDADSKDTADFCKIREMPRHLKYNFSACLKKVDAVLKSFLKETELQKARTIIQEQAFERSQKDASIYLLNMPTGSGKTLASLRIALQKAVLESKERIIYVIPYNSIIEQTADVFESIFGNDMELLRHQSTFAYENVENISEDYRQAAKLAIENWDAPFIITTAVQFFETIYSNKRGKLRKMHNMANSILVFDEAHLMPEEYLQPCLQGIAYITKYLNSKAIFLTATMPNFEMLLDKYTLSGTRMVNLITDKKAFSEFKKCKYIYLGERSVESIVQERSDSPSRLYIVNTKKTARKLYEVCCGKKYHLSTYMTAYDRDRILKKIRYELTVLEHDFSGLKNVPEDRRISIISTSLIEAGVDLDVCTVFRETAGLDNILQAGGRCNREGKRDNAVTYIFDIQEDDRKKIMDERINLTKGLLKKYSDISCGQCIDEYYSRLFNMHDGIIQKNTMHQFCSDIRSIPFKTYAERFELINTRTVSLVVERDDSSMELVQKLKNTSGVNARQLQKYTCTIQRWELDDLMKQHAVDDYGTGIFCLTNSDYYDDELGITFEAVDYFI